MKVLIVGHKRLVDEIQPILFRLNPRIDHANDKKSYALALKRAPDVIILDADSRASWADTMRFLRAAGPYKKNTIVICSARHFSNLTAASRLGAHDVVTRPYNHRELILRVNSVVCRKVRIACIGGGTGLFTLLLGLKSIPKAILTSIVNMSDDGGSSGKLTQSFGVLPPGDIRRSLVALSNAPEVMNEILQYRFDKGAGLSGHSFGNIFLTVLAQVKGSMSEAVRALSDILNIQGIVFPATTTMTSLIARFADGSVVKGESKIDLCWKRDPDLRLTKLSHTPTPQGFPDAVAAILHSDIVTIGPGDLFTSVLSNLSIKEIRDAVAQTRAKKIYICNLMTKPGETAHFDVADHVAQIRKCLGRDALDMILVSNSPLSRKALTDYAKKRQEPVALKRVGSLRKLTRAQVLVADIGHAEELVRHDSAKLKDLIEKIIHSLPNRL